MWTCGRSAGLQPNEQMRFPSIRAEQIHSLPPLITVARVAP